MGILRSEGEEQRQQEEWRETEAYLHCVRSRVSLLLSLSNDRSPSDGGAGPASVSLQGKGLQEAHQGRVGTALAAGDMACVRWESSGCREDSHSERQSAQGHECEGARVALLAGVACLLLFTQANVTGSALPPHSTP